MIIATLLAIFSLIVLYLVYFTDVTRMLAGNKDATPFPPPKDCIMAVMNSAGTDVEGTLTVGT